jgi:hypothetical protein
VNRHHRPSARFLADALYHDGVEADHVALSTVEALVFAGLGALVDRAVEGHVGLAVPLASLGFRS